MALLIHSYKPRFREMGYVLMMHSVQIGRGLSLNQPLNSQPLDFLRENLYWLLRQEDGVHDDQGNPCRYYEKRKNY